jgi:hypothetical protein
VALWDDDIIGRAARSESAKTFIRNLLIEFLTLFIGMPIHKAQAQLGSDRGGLLDFTALGILWSDDANYFPGFCALYFMPQGIRSSGERYVDSFLEFVRDLYSERGVGPYTLEDICADLAKTSRWGFSSGSIIIGAHLARSFTDFFYSFEGSPQTSRVGLLTDKSLKLPQMRFQLKDTILDYKDLSTAWERQLKPKFISFLSSQTREPQPTVTLRSGNTFEFDVFICHASEDKKYVEPLVQALEQVGIHVWFDGITLEWGDDLRPAIDRGIIACRYGIVVFSKAFLRRKKWTEYELDSLFAREQAGEKLILPIWHEITRDDLVQYSPGFADRLAKISSTDTYDEIVRSLLVMLGRPSRGEVRGQVSSAVSTTNPDQVKSNAVAYARYETKGHNSLRAEVYVRPSRKHEGWFLFENSFGEEHHGLKDEIAERFAAFDKSLIAKGYVRMHHGNLGDPAFNL